MANENEVEALIEFVFKLLNDGFISMSNVRDGLARAREEGTLQSVAAFQHVIDCYNEMLNDTIAD